MWSQPIVRLLKLGAELGGGITFRTTVHILLSSTESAHAGWRTLSVIMQKKHLFQALRRTAMLPSNIVFKRLPVGCCDVAASCGGPTYSACTNDISGSSVVAV